jgi:redox-sensitive bicupin YhaK (pirin superfamily)
MNVRKISQITQSVPVTEGAGVKLRRAFGFKETRLHDPYLLLDDFRGDREEDYIRGFPWHPHRGIETVTYMLEGSVEHGDSLENKGVISRGDVQWMTAGSGIIHQEMPRGDADGRMYGFQLWVNLPSSAKMTEPRYQEYGTEDIPVVTNEKGCRAKIICGTLWKTTGPVDGEFVAPFYADIYVPPGVEQVLPADEGRNAFAYVFQGSGTFGAAGTGAAAVAAEAGGSGAAAEAGSAFEAVNRDLIVFGEGDSIIVKAGGEGVRFLLITGEPVNEPVAWRGPIVMNTREELDTAFAEIEKGTFLKGR